MGKLDGKVAVITGATSGMALASAKLFVEEGAFVFITGRRKENLDEAVKAIGRNVIGVQGDSAKLADLDRLYDSVTREKGYVDVLFASAGQGGRAPLGTITEEQFDTIFSLNTRGTYGGSTGLRSSRSLRKSGPIVVTDLVKRLRLEDAKIVYEGYPACTPPVNASMAALRLATHYSRPGWLATAFLCYSFIHNSTPVWPGALNTLLSNVRHVRGIFTYPEISDTPQRTRARPHSSPGIPCRCL